ncbi:unnamed protein product [marine sediment metagenome]|uniref:Uncharacterized protein n=1 Tax=marine sediment metagenome TaxID=412755 RepID=X1KN49_9ZZZZ
MKAFILSQINRIVGVKMPPRGKKSIADVYPQWLDFEVLQTGTNIWTVEAIPLPVPRLRREVGDQVQLIEILKVILSPNLNEITDGSRVSLKLMTRNWESDPKEGPTTVFTVSLEPEVMGTEASHVAVEPYMYDLTDGMGHGYLVAVDTLYLGCASGGMTTPTGGSGRIYWRYVTVNLAEFMGLIQSQTG